MFYHTIKRELQYSGPLFDVVKVTLQLPNKKERPYDLVEHTNSVAIVPVDKNGMIVFVSQFRVGVGDILLELPAGLLDPGEEPLVSAHREVREEIGMAAHDMRLLGEFYLSPGWTDEYISIFLARDLYPSPLQPDDDEFINLVTMPIEEVYEKAYAGEFKDGKTLAALLLAEPFLCLKK